MARKPSDEAVAAARAYLRGLTPSITSPSPESLRDTAVAIEELGLINEYLSRESRYTRKRRAYAEAKGRTAAQTSRSEGADS